MNFDKKLKKMTLLFKTRISNFKHSFMNIDEFSYKSKGEQPLKPLKNPNSRLGQVNSNKFF